jgi:hypothetical protein
MSTDEAINYTYKYGSKTYTRKYIPKRKYEKMKQQTINQITELQLDPNNQYITNYNIYYEKYPDISYPYFIKCFKLYQAKS